jgi:small-conductance mechanosensitive channel
MVVPGRTLQFDSLPHGKGKLMNNIIYIVGLVVVIIAILSFFGLR